VRRGTDGHIKAEEEEGQKMKKDVARSSRSVPDG